MHPDGHTGTSRQGLLGRLGRQGPLTLASRLSSKALDFLHRNFLLRLRRPIGNLVGAGRRVEGVLYAFYDKAVSPTTFDFVLFFILAELERTKRGCRSLHVVFVGYDEEKSLEVETGQFTRLLEGTSNYGRDFLHWRLQNILVPCCALLSSCSGITICSSRDEAVRLERHLARNVFPGDYLARYPADRSLMNHVAEAVSRGDTLPSLEVPKQALAYARSWLESRCSGRRVITVSLREASYSRSRNSDLDAWGGFIESLDTSQYCPVVIRDTEATDPLPSSFDGAELFHEGAWNLLLRAAVYELSYLNLMVSNGPAALCYCNAAVRYIVFKIIADSTVSSRSFLEGRGLKEGDQWFSPGNEFQKFIWETDSRETISEEFAKMCFRMEKARR